MSVANLRAGLSDLTTSVASVKKEKQDRIAKEEKQKLQFELGNKILASTEGKTSVGELTGYGVQAGLIEPKEALSEIQKLTPEQKILLLHSRIASTTDDTERESLKAIANDLTQKYQMFNYQKAYDEAKAKSLGDLEAKSFYGQLPTQVAAARKGGRGGGGDGGEGDLSGLDEGFSKVKKRDDLLKYTFSAKDLNKDYVNLITTDPIMKKYFNPATGVLKQNFDEGGEPPTKVIKEVNDRLLSFSRDYIRGKDKVLNLPGFEGELEYAANEMRKAIMVDGYTAITKTGQEKGNIIVSSLTIPLDIPKKKLVEAYQQQDKQSAKDRENLMKNIKSSVSYFGDILRGKNKQKDSIKSVTQAPANYYLE